MTDIITLKSMDVINFFQLLGSFEQRLEARINNLKNGKGKV